MLTNKSFPTIEALDSAMTKIFWDEYNEYTIQGMDFFTQMSADEMKGDTVTYVYGGGVFGDLDVYESGEGLEGKGQYTYVDGLGGFYATRKYTAFGKGIIIHDTDLQDEKFPEIIDQSKNLAILTRRWLTKDILRIFTYSNATTDDLGRSVIMPDTTALCADSHYYKGKGNVSTAGTTGFDNLLTGALSPSSLDAARLLGAAFRTNDNQLLEGSNFNTLIIPPELEKKAVEIFGSDNIPYEISNTKNFFNSEKYQVLVWPLLSDPNTPGYSSTAWYLVDRNRMKQCLRWGWKVPIEYSAMEKDANTRNWKKHVYLRYTRYVKDWRWIIKSTGTT